MKDEFEDIGMMFKTGFSWASCSSASGLHACTPIDGRGVQVVGDLALAFCPFVQPWGGIIIGVILSIKTLVCYVRLSEDLMDLCIVLNY